MNRLKVAGLVLLVLVVLALALLAHVFWTAFMIDLGERIGVRDISLSSGGAIELCSFAPVLHAHGEPELDISLRSYYVRCTLVDVPPFEPRPELKRRSEPQSIRDRRDVT